MHPMFKSNRDKIIYSITRRVSFGEVVKIIRKEYPNGCICCGKSLEDINGRGSIGDLFCSWECHKEFNNMVNWNFLRMITLKKANYECEICGVCKKPDNWRWGHSDLHIHHIVPIHTRGSYLDPQNLMVVCKKCHKWLHSNRHYTSMEIYGYLASKYKCSVKFGACKYIQEWKQKQIKREEKRKKKVLSDKAQCSLDKYSNEKL